MIRVVHLGLGEIGKGTIDAVLAQPKQMKLVAVVDINPAFVGRNLRDVMGRKDVPSLKITASLKDALPTNPDVATMTTGSRTIDVRETLEDLIKARVHVVSTCE